MSGTGRFVVFEGCEGAGKSTQLRRLAASLIGSGWSVTDTAEPGGSTIGQRIRQLLLDPEVELHPRAEALLFAADRAQHVATVIRPALARGDVVLCDRYIDSSVAYQGAGRQLGGPDIVELSTWATEALLPDLVVLLDIDPEHGLNRVRLRNLQPLDRVEQEQLDFHHRVREGFLARAGADPQRYLVLDAALSPAVLATTIAGTVKVRLGASMIGDSGHEHDTTEIVVFGADTPIRTFTRSSLDRRPAGQDAP